MLGDAGVGIAGRVQRLGVEHAKLVEHDAAGPKVAGAEVDLRTEYRVSRAKEYLHLFRIGDLRVGAGRFVVDAVGLHADLDQVRCCDNGGIATRHVEAVATAHAGTISPCNAAWIIRVVVYLNPREALQGFAKRGHRRRARGEPDRSRQCGLLENVHSYLLWTVSLVGRLRRDHYVLVGHGYAECSPHCSRHRAVRGGFRELDTREPTGSTV